MGVSGGKDSTFQALYVKNELKMNPLLVCLSYPPEQLNYLGIKNLENLIRQGFDLYTIYPDPTIWKRIMRTGFFRFCNFLKGCELALFSSVPKLAVQLGIPLIWWGENSALQLGETKIYGNSPWDGSKLCKMNTLGGGSIKWLLEAGFGKSELFDYTFPKNSVLKKHGIKTVFLGPFIRSWNSRNNANYSILHGLSINKANPAIDGDLHGITALDDNWVSINQMIKYYKFGFGRMTDDVNEEIWAGRLSREDGIKLCEQYDGRYDKTKLNSLCDYLDISKRDFWKNVEKFMDQTLFTRIKNGIYKPKFTVGQNHV